MFEPVLDLNYFRFCIVPPAATRTREKWSEWFITHGRTWAAPCRVHLASREIGRLVSSAVRSKMFLSYALSVPRGQLSASGRGLPSSCEGRTRIECNRCCVRVTITRISCTKKITRLRGSPTQFRHREPECSVYVWTRGMHEKAANSVTVAWL